MKRPGREADQSPLSSTDIKKAGAVLSILPHSFPERCVIN